MGLDSLLFQSQKLVQTSGPKGGLRIVVASHVLSLDVHVRHRALTRHRQQFVLQGFTVGTSIQFVYGHVHARKLLSQQILCRSAVRWKKGRNARGNECEMNASNVLQSLHKRNLRQ